ncbi:deSI-like protein At4g17486 isoform X2 [Macadamia integrifolia]|uniref:deSI-like protein At4g17486 isoform X2 n=1 Tax=Macadamia integrifolia TaxID=60698 RepID=UPI001C52E337|nr:deSI-like protein At4g17486 isoform X2 [Macadamia integrifolia]
MRPFLSRSVATKEQSNGRGNRAQLYLNVYDLTPINNYLYWFGLGIYHSGIEVHGMEYAFGAHEYPTSGVFEVEPRCCPGFIYRRSVLLGSTDMSRSEFRSFMEHFAGKYHGDSYHLIAKNCNHFTNDVSTRLTGKCIPGWVNRLARLGSFCNCLLPESIQVTAIRHLPDHPAYSVQRHSMYHQTRSPRMLVQNHHRITPWNMFSFCLTLFFPYTNQQKMGLTLLHHHQKKTVRRTPIITCLLRQIVMWHL